MSAIPRVSVVLPVYNAGALLSDAVESILDQTFTDFELVAVNDGSTDGSGELLDAFAARDRRVRVIHQENRKQVATMNRAIAEARGEYIARMDADDRSYPERLAKQIAFLDAHPEVGVLGTYSDVAFPTYETVWDPDTGHTLLCWRLLSTTPMVHPSVTMRADVLRAAGGYALAGERLEDYELFERLSHVTRLANLPECLVWYNRTQTTNISTLHFDAQQGVARNVHQRVLASYGLTPSDEVLDAYSRFAFVGEEALADGDWSADRVRAVAQLLWRLTTRFVEASDATADERSAIWDRTYRKMQLLTIAHGRLTGQPRRSSAARLAWAPRLTLWALSGRRAFL